MATTFSLAKYHRCVDTACTIQSNGKVTNVVGLVIEAQGPVSRLGTICDIYTKGNSHKITAEVLGFKDNKVLMMPLAEIRGIGPGCPIVARQQRAVIPVGSGLLGRVIDGLGNPIDNKGPIPAEREYPIYGTPINPLTRQRISKPLDLGIRAINGLLSVGCGQRMGIFAGSGVGKSVLLGMIARKTAADVNVIALIGERGREVNEFIEKELGKEGLERSVVVVATSDHLPLIRMRGAFIATAIAEFFRDQGRHVNLMMDSVTRFAMAQREIGLALGEPPTTKGYTPSVFTLLPKLCERAGTSANRGTITGLYTVLVEGDDTNEPIADALRAVLDGHINLTRDLATQNHYPAIDVLSSISRVMDDIINSEQRQYANQLKEILAIYRKDYAIEMIEKINHYLKQDIDETTPFDDSIAQLSQLFEP
jgi:flagellum-specific ATP synthase